MDAAAPIPARSRDSFLRDVASELAKFEVIGPGVVGRVCSKLNPRRRTFAASAASGTESKLPREVNLNQHERPDDHGRQQHRDQ
jgi:hypothetical protein